MKIEFNLPEGYSFETKINGQAVVYHPGKMHESWLIRFLEKGMQRYANDMFSGEKGNTKLDLCRGIAQEANSGEAAPERTMRKASLPDDQALAVKNAKQDLNMLFKQITGMGRIADMVEHEKVKPFFSEGPNGPTWEDEAVLAWIEKRKESGKDYLAEAKQSLEAINSAADLL